MRNLEFNEDRVSSYYRRQFAIDVPSYLKMELHDDKNVILSVNKNDRCNSKLYMNSSGCPSGYSLLGKGSTRKNFVFAGLFAYMILTQQAINAICGSDAEDDFHRCTGWPWISAGLAGSDYSFRNMLQEANLYPVDAEKENYVKMLEVVKTFMNKEMSEFLLEINNANLNPEAYRRLISSVKGRVDEVIGRISEEIDGLIVDLQK